jgi:hypothetical protein
LPSGCECGGIHLIRTFTLAIATLLLVTGMPMTGAALDDPLATGSHFTLNVLGKEKVGAGTGDKVGGSKIFVPLHGNCRIDLSEGGFQVQDADCVNDPRAAFRLPNPDPENTGVSHYSIYVRPLGKPGGSAVFTTCLEDEDGETWCSTESVYVARVGGYSPSTDVSREMLTVCYDRDGDGTYEREQIFDDANRDYFWSYENSGLRLAQLRFYPAPADISGPCPAA